MILGTVELGLARPAWLWFRARAWGTVVRLYCGHYHSQTRFAGGRLRRIESFPPEAVHHIEIPSCPKQGQVPVNCGFGPSGPPRNAGPQLPKHRPDYRLSAIDMDELDIVGGRNRHGTESLLYEAMMV